MSIYEQEAIKRELRAYWNDCGEVHDQWNTGMISTEEAYAQTIKLDTKYAKRIQEIKE